MFEEYLKSPPFRSMLTLGVVSTVNSLFNRILMTKFFFDYPIVILMIQMAFTLAAIECGRLLNIVKIPAYTFQRGRDIFTASLFFTISSYLTLNCLDGTTMPIFPFIQRFAPLVIIAIGVYNHRKQRFGRSGITIISVICIGSALSSIYEWSIDLWSLNYGLLALGLHSMAIIHVEKLHDSGTYTSSLELVYLNSFNSLCLFLIADLLQDEIRDSFMYMVTSTTWLFVTCFSILILLGALLHAALFHCIGHVGAVHASLINILSGGIQLFVAYGLSIYLFYDLAPTWSNIIGVVVSIIVTLYYYFKVKPIDFKNYQASSKFLISKS